MGELWLASKIAWRGGACSAFLACLTVPAPAQDKVEWSGTISGTTDYVFRGFSLTKEHPAAQASLDGSYGIFFVGVWGSNISDGGGYEPVELDLYAGIKPQWGPATFDFSAYWYTYPGSIPGPIGFQYVELKAGLSFSPIAGVKVNPILWYVPEQKYSTEIFTYEGALTYDLPAAGDLQPTLGGLVGYAAAREADTFAPGVDSYAYWNAGIALTIKKVTFDLRYWDTSIADDLLANEHFEFTGAEEEEEGILAVEDEGALAGERIVLTATVALP